MSRCTSSSIMPQGLFLLRSDFYMTCTCTARSAQRALKGLCRLLRRLGPATVEAALAKRRKKNAAKDHRYLPAARRQELSDCQRGHCRLESTAAELRNCVS